MNKSGNPQVEEAATITAVADVHCRERGIDLSSDEANKIVGVVETLMNSGTRKPDDIRAALKSQSEQDCATTLGDPRACLKTSVGPVLRREERLNVA